MGAVYMHVLLEAGEAELPEAVTESLPLNDYTMELKEGAQFAWSTIFSSRFFYALILLVLMVVLFKVVDLAIIPIRRRNNSPMVGFLAGIVKAVIAFAVVIRIMNLFWVLSDLTEQILMSSSLLVVVLGFVFQEGLTNIVHGFILSVSMPFKIGDRVSVTIDGNVLTGYVRTMGLRATSIQNVENNALVIVPNSKLDLGLIQNNYLDDSKSSSAFLDLSVTYDSDLDHTLEVLRECILQEPLVQAERMRTGQSGPPSVLVRSFGDSGINIRGIVTTHTVEENFTACSQIRIAVKRAFDDDPAISFAYPHLQIVGHNGIAPEKAPESAGKE